MKKTLVTMAIVIVISLLFASDFYIGCQSGLSPRGTNYWSYCADSLFSLIKHAEFNNTMTEITHDNHLVPLMDKLNVDGIKTVLVDQRIDNSIAPSTWKSPTALALSNYWRFEAEFSSSFDVDGGTQDKHWYCSDSRDTLRVGSIDDQSGPYSNEYRWKAEPSSSLPNGGWVLSNLGRRWPRNGYHDYRIGDEFQFTGRNYFNSDSTFDSYLTNNYLYISFAFSFEDYASLTSADSLLGFDVVGYTGSKFTVLDHENVTLGVSGDLSVLTKGQYDSLPDDSTYDTNKLVTLKISLQTMKNNGFLAHKDGNNWKLLMGNISPRVYWHGNATLNFDYLDFYDSVYDELQAITVSTNGGINYLTSVSDLFNTHGNTITNVYGFNEPKQPQMKSHERIEAKLNETFVGNPQRGDALFTSIHDSYIDYIKTGGVPFDNPTLFLDTANPKLFMPNLYYLEAEHSFNDTTHPSVQGQLTKLHNSYKRYKLNLEQEASLADTKYYICTQSMGTWFGEQTVPYWSWLRPPKETQKAIQLLPLCYGVDGIHSFFFQSWNASENITRYWAAVNVPELTNPSGISLSGAYWGLKEANEKIKVYGPLLSSDRTHDAGTSPQLKWEDSFAINQSEDPIAYFDGQIISLPSIGLSGMNVKTSPGLYQGFVHAGIYTNQATGLPSIMLVNRRANYFNPSMVHATPTNIPPSILDAFFTPAPAQTTKFLTNQTANTLAGTYPSFFDPFTNEIHVSSNSVMEVDIDPGDGVLLQMCSSLPASVTSDAEIKNIAYLSGPITIDDSAEVTIHVGTQTTIFPHSTILVKGNSILNLAGTVTIADSVNIIVEEGSSINFNEADCTWGESSILKVTGGTLSISGGSMNKSDNISRWPGIRVSDSSQVLMDNATISNAQFNACENSNCMITNSRFYIPGSSSGLIICNTSSGYTTEISNTMPGKGFYGTSDQGSTGIYLSAIQNQVNINNVNFHDLETGISKDATPYAIDTVNECDFVNCKTGIDLFFNESYTVIEWSKFTNDQPGQNVTGIYLIASSPSVSNCYFNNLYCGVQTESSLQSVWGTNHTYISESYFKDCNRGIDSRNSNHYLKENYVYNNSYGIVNRASSNLNLSYNKNNVMKNIESNIVFYDTFPYQSTIQLLAGHNDFYHMRSGVGSYAVDFDFNSYYYDSQGGFGVLRKINASDNWFEGAQVTVNDSLYAGYVYVDSYDLSPSMPPPGPNTGRLFMALDYESQELYELAAATFKAIIDEDEEDEKSDVTSAIDGLYRCTFMIPDPSWELTDYFDTKAMQFASDDPGLSAIFKDYLAKVFVLNKEFQDAVDLIQLGIDNPISEIDSLRAVLDLEIVLQLAAMEEEKRPLTTKYIQYQYPDVQIFEKKHSDNWDKYSRLLLQNNADTASLIAPMPLIQSNFPNPFNPSTTITFSIPEAGRVRVSVYNLKGQKVKDLINTDMLRGNHKLVWDGKDAHNRNASSGIYFLRLESGGKTSIRKAMLMK